jgi:PKD repeat protein
VWNFGDGASQSGVELRTVQHTYAAAGTFNATLTVTNPNNETDQTTRTVRVIVNESPVVMFTVSDTTGEAPITIDFDAADSFDPEGTDLT